MTRGSWKFGAWSAAGQTVISGLLAINRLWSNDSFAVFFWIYTAWFAVSVAQFLNLLRVRRNDETFWDEEEARRADWDRRGRQL
ncbi:hypothetical protein BJG92_03529 [Arthrobacter sp. SO5]|uniref:hypothetical protein n=1 Tax=Arthrobacter sp. SO5 TaxID=1897055 RepID=UPI001E2F4365|nr:hypothetical protein [Arthrobacter sp. SO5]MCB5275974.1 hypothetical protein [Arthrobacter sp. SO5]